MEGQGSVIGISAPEFKLMDQFGKTWTLDEAVKLSSALLVFYPGDFNPVCKKQLCNYRDSLSNFEKLGVKIFGISGNSQESHAKFAKQYEFPFPLLSDPNRQVTRAYGCTSLLMLGATSRAVCIINKRKMILYRYVEPTVLTHRKADELVGILEDLKANSLL